MKKPRFDDIKLDEGRVIEIKPKKLILEEEYIELLEYKFRYLELKEIMDKWISLNEKEKEE